LELPQYDSKMKLVYSILDGPLPVEAYKSTMQVTDLSNGKSELMWSSSFNPKRASEKESKEAIEGIYNMGFEGILNIWLNIPNQFTRVSLKLILYYGLKFF